MLVRCSAKSNEELLIQSDLTDIHHHHHHHHHHNNNNNNSNNNLHNNNEPSSDHTTEDDAPPSFLHEDNAEVSSIRIVDILPHGGPPPDVTELFSSPPDVINKFGSPPDVINKFSSPPDVINEFSSPPDDVTQQFCNSEEEENTSLSPTSPSPVVAVKRKYVCDICQRDFSTKSNLNRHRKKCNASLRFYCEICGDVFFRSYDLILHQRTHSKPADTAETVETAETAKTVASSASFVEKDPRSNMEHENGPINVSDQRLYENGESYNDADDRMLPQARYRCVDGVEKDYERDVDGGGFCSSPLPSAATMKIVYQSLSDRKVVVCDGGSIGADDNDNNNNNNNNNNSMNNNKNNNNSIANHNNNTVALLKPVYDNQEGEAIFLLNGGDFSTTQYALSSFQQKPSTKVSGTRDPDRLRCFKCFKHFSTKSNLNRHVKMCKGPTANSSISSNRPIKRRSSSKHVAISNGGEQQQRQTYISTSLGAQPYIMTTSRLECPKCTNVFSTKSNLNRHIKACPGRAQTFSYVIAAATTEKPVASSPPIQQPLPPLQPVTSPSSHPQPPPSGHKPRSKVVYQCQVCSKVCLTSYALLEHERVHTGDRPFQCSHCRKSFTTKSNWRRHLIHSCMKKREPDGGAGRPVGNNLFSPHHHSGGYPSDDEDAGRLRDEYKNTSLKQSPREHRLVYVSEEMLLKEEEKEEGHPPAYVIYNDVDDGGERHRDGPRDSSESDFTGRNRREEGEMNNFTGIADNNRRDEEMFAEHLHGCTDDGEEIVIVQPNFELDFNSTYHTGEEEEFGSSDGEGSQGSSRDGGGGGGGGGDGGGGGGRGELNSLLSKCISRLNKRQQVNTPDKSHQLNPSNNNNNHRVVRDFEPKLYNGSEEIVIVHAEPEMLVDLPEYHHHESMFSRGEEVFVGSQHNNMVVIGENGRNNNNDNDDSHTMCCEEVEEEDYSYT